ncbi:MAG: hypothetical protein ACREU4_00765 [Burkholderiales bacterium]
MRTVSITLAAALALLAGFAAGAQEFVFESAEPRFTVTIPGIPPLRMGPHPMRDTHPHLRFQGAEGAYSVSIITPGAAPGMSARECASATLRSLAARPSVPPIEEMYRTRLDEATFAVIYATQMPGFLQLNAHLLSAAAGTHCVEVHASKIATSEDDVAPWFGGFGKARIAAP